MPRNDSPNPTANLLDRKPPSDVQAEQAALGSAMILPELLDDLCGLLRPEDFYDPAHGEIYRHMLELYDSKQTIDIVLLVKQIGPALQQLGGEAYLAEIAHATPTAANGMYYANIVRENAIRRGMIHAGMDITRMGWEDGDISELVARAEEKVLTSLENPQAAVSFSVREVLSEAITALDNRKAGGSSGVPTGYPDADKALSGLCKSHLIILAARPSMGKSALAMNLAENIADAGKSVLFVSLEMNREELGNRLLSSRSRVPLHRMRNGTYDSEDMRKILEAAAEIDRLKLFITDRSGLRVNEIAALARRTKRRQGLDLLVIDYLQLIEPADGRTPREQQVAQISRRLKGLARELDIPVLCLAQLNRQTEAARDNRPRLSHLRESGSIEQDADEVLFIHRPEYYMTEKEIDDQKAAGKAVLIIAKQRSGPLEDVPLVWFKDWVRFESSVASDMDNYEPQFSSYGNHDDDGGLF